MLTTEANAPVRPRTITGDLEVQIHNPETGRFCRQAIGGMHYACGPEIDRRQIRPAHAFVPAAESHVRAEGLRLAREATVDRGLLARAL